MREETKGKEWLLDELRFMSSGRYHKEWNRAIDFAISKAGEMTEVSNVEYNHKIVKVPQFIADWIKRAKNDGEWPGIFFDDACVSPEIQEWNSSIKNCEIFMSAWTNDYEVEEEPKWVVRSDKNAWFHSFNNDKDDMKYGFYSHSQVALKSSAFHFEDQGAADAVATLIGGYATLAKEVNNG